MWYEFLVCEVEDTVKVEEVMNDESNQNNRNTGFKNHPTNFSVATLVIRRKDP